MLHIEPHQIRTRKFIHEHRLIAEVKQKPVLYDKTCNAYRKYGATENAWQDIARKLGVQAEDCKKRWKSLRDRFIKYYRIEVIAGVNPDDKRKNWDYYDQMSYLKAHVELFRLPDHDTDTDVERKKSTAIGNKGSKAPGGSNEGYLSADDVSLEIIEDSQTEYFYEDGDGAEITTELKVEKNIDVLSGSEDETLEEDDGKERPAKDVTDPDERFLLSCAPVLKRLSRQKNALVRLKIQTLLYEVEFGEEGSSSAKMRKCV